MRESQEGPMRILFIELLENIYHAGAWWGAVVSKWTRGLVGLVIRLPTFCLLSLSHIDIVTDLPPAPNCSSIIIMANSLQLSNPDISCLIKIESYFTQFIVKLFIFHQIRTESALALLLYKLLLLNWEDSKCMGEQVEKIWMEENRKKTFGR